MTDNGEQGAFDTLGSRSRTRTAVKWLSSNWSGMSTLERRLAGENLSVGQAKE